MKKSFFLALMVIVLLVATAGCIQTTEQNPNEKVTLTVGCSDVEGTLLFQQPLEVEKGANAFDAVKENFSVEFEMYEMGPFVKGIGACSPSEGEYLALYVNGEYASQGISFYTVQEDMEIQWKIESIESFG